MNVILDSNFILDVFFFKDSIAVPLFKELQKTGAQFYRTEETTEELKHVLMRDQFLHGDTSPSEVIHSWENASTLCSKPASCSLKCRDPLDQKFIDLAFSLAPCCLISKDNDILKLRRKASKLKMKFGRPDEFICLNCQID